MGDGGLTQFAAHTGASAPLPQSWLTLVAGLAMFGAAAGRRYAGPTDLRTNICVIGVADSKYKAIADAESAGIGGRASIILARLEEAGMIRITEMPKA